MRGEPYELDPETVERLINGATGDLSPDLVRLAELIAAARAPGYPDDLTGMDAALIAFREARLPREAPPGRDRTGRGSVVRRVLSLQSVTVALVVGALGGGALAAATGSLPGLPTSDRPDITRSSASADASPTATPSARRAGQASAPAVQTTPPRQAPAGWCRTHQAARNKAAPHPSPLVEAAGGPKKVPAYCARLLRSRPSDRPRPTDGQGPSKTKHPTLPTARPTSR